MRRTGTASGGERDKGTNVRSEGEMRRQKECATDRRICGETESVPYKERWGHYD